MDWLDGLIEKHGRMASYRRRAEAEPPEKIRGLPRYLKPGGEKPLVQHHKCPVCLRRFDLELWMKTNPHGLCGQCSGFTGAVVAQSFQWAQSIIDTVRNDPGLPGCAITLETGPFRFEVPSSARDNLADHLQWVLSERERLQEDGPPEQWAAWLRKYGWTG